jgi:hypothetical protein
MKSFLTIKNEGDCFIGNVVDLIGGLDDGVMERP